MIVQYSQCRECKRFYVRRTKRRRGTVCCKCAYIMRKRSESPESVAKRRARDAARTRRYTAEGRYQNRWWKNKASYDLYRKLLRGGMEKQDARIEATRHYRRVTSETDNQNRLANTRTAAVA